MGLIKSRVLGAPIKLVLHLLEPFIPKPPKKITSIRSLGAQLKENKKYFVFNVTLGLMIMLLLHLFSDFKPVIESEDEFADVFIQLTANDKSKKGSTAYTFLDFDDESFTAWNEPFFTPRDKLLKLIQASVDAHAKVVVVDIDLHRPADIHYNRLLDYLDAYDDSCAARAKNNEPCAAVILVRSFAMPNKESIAIIRLAPARLESIVSRSANIHWASTLYEVSSDHKVRYWNLWQSACNAGDQSVPQIIPSVQLLALTLARSRHPANNQQELMRRLQVFIPPSCKRSDEKHNLPVEPLHLDGFQIDFDQERVSRRVFYSIPRKASTALTDSGEHVLHTIPAHIITDNHGQESSTAMLQNRIVLIGASHIESGDIHHTPLGTMPGSLIIINAMHSLQQYGDIASPHWLIKVVFEIILILMMSLAFLILESFWGYLFCLLVFASLLLPVSILLVGQGIWLDLALPLLALGIRQIAAEFEEMRKDHKMAGENQIAKSN